MDRSKKIAEWILRIGIFGSFLAHGIFALGVEQSWIPFLTTVGFSEDTAITLLPIIGSLDIIVAFLSLLWPVRIVLIWAALWAFAAALIIPISGDSIWEFLEHWAYWASPLALLVLQGFPKKLKDIFSVR